MMTTIFNKTSLAKVALIITLPILLIACGGPHATPVKKADTGNTPNETPPAATEEVRAFEVNVWNNLKASNRCGQCHYVGPDGQPPAFADDTDVNLAFSEVTKNDNNGVPLFNLQEPAKSALVTKVGSGHNCWESSDSACADTIKNMISNWAGLSGGESTERTIVLTAPDIKDPGDSKTFPIAADHFAATVHPLLVQRCIACHYEEGLSQQQSPFFANPDENSAYEAVKPKINIDLPENSQLVLRLRGDFHNCWSNCADNANEMQAAIEQFAGAISTTQIDPALITSKALVLLDDGIIASGGSRHESNQIALWEFKTGKGSTAFDTSGIFPAINLGLEGQYDWLASYGLDFSGGKAWADTQSSKKLHSHITASGEYSIETWVVPANVTQEDANMLSLDAGSAQKNFALSQTLYNYNFHNRSSLTDDNGEPLLSTPNADEVLQSSLQHVVATYTPTTGRTLYVNGEQIITADPITDPTSISNWKDSFAFVLGNSISGDRPWSGKIRMASIHNRVLTAEQITQNFNVGVGQKYFLLFSIAEQIGIADSYIRFEVSQFDSFSYLFNQPTFINLNPDWVPGGFNIQKMRIGINGKQAIAGQSFGSMDTTVDNRYTAADGQLLSSHGTIIALEKGADNDEFFLTFESLANQNNPFIEPAPTPPATPADAAPVSEIGVRTFDEINSTIAKITGIPVTNSKINALFQQYKQQLPTIETIDAFLPSHQMAIAQLALTSCSERVDADKALLIGSSGRVMFSDFDFSLPASTAFDSETKRNNAINPVLDAVLTSNLASQPDHAEIASLLGATTPQQLTNTTGNPLVDPDGVFTDGSYQSLISQMNTINTTQRTAQIVKAVCAAAVGSAAMLIQ